MVRTKLDRLKALLRNGYFPDELPPPFRTKSLAKFASSIGKKWERASASQPNRPPSIPATLPEVFSLAGYAHRRRRLEIPNPINQFFVAKFIAEHWVLLRSKINASNLSMTKCEITDQLRSVPFTKFRDKKIRELHCSSQHYFSLTSDIARFYHTIYTHSIPWAVHGKTTAKKNRNFHSAACVANQLDFYIRQGQDGQTIGIPVGPDTSRIISEIIASQIDEQLCKRLRKMSHSGFRYIDDYQLCFDTQEDAHFAFTSLVNACKNFELDINHEKTQINDIGNFSESTWPQAIKRQKLLSNKNTQGKSIIDYFTNVLSVAAAHSDENIMKYALKASLRTLIHRENWAIYENSLVKIGRIYPHSIPFITRH